MMPDPVLCILIYLAIGTLIWCFLVRADIVGNSYYERVQRGDRLPHITIALASLLSILVWPYFLPWLWAKAKWSLKKWGVLR